MRVRYENRDGVTVATLESPTVLGGEPAARLAEEIAEWIEREVLVVVDASRVLDFAPDGIDVLLSLERRLRRRSGWIVLKGLRDELRRRFRRSGLDAVFVVEPDLERGAVTLGAPTSGQAAWH